MSDGRLQQGAGSMTRKLVFLVTAFAILASANLAAAQQSDGKIPRISFASLSWRTPLTDQAV